MTDREQKTRKVRRRKTTGRVGGTTQSGFAAKSMTGILEQAQARQADKPQVEKAQVEKARNKKPADSQEDGKGG